jgi:hypothetical protein
MSPVAIYRCPKCKTEYRPLDAGARHHMCCGVELERIESGKQPLLALLQNIQHLIETLFVSPVQPSAMIANEVLEIIPPRENQVDVLALELMLGRLAIETTFSLEIAGDSRMRRFLIRAPHETLVHLRRQIQATYPQAEFRAVPTDQDPTVERQLARMSADFTLRRPLYLPLRTFHNGDFLEADPVLGLLGTFADLEEGERMLSQIILFPAPSNWADRYQGSERQIEQSMGGGGATSQDLFVRQLVGLVVSVVFLFIVLWGG